MLDASGTGHVGNERYPVGALIAVTALAMELVFLVPLMWSVGMAVSVKRWHDRVKSGWWVLIETGFFPVLMRRTDM